MLRQSGQSREKRSPFLQIRLTVGAGGDMRLHDNAFGFVEAFLDECLKPFRRRVLR